MIILTAIPAFLLAFGIICAKNDRRLLFCAAAAVCVFAVCGLTSLAGFVGADADKLPLISSLAGQVSFEDLGIMNAPPGYLIIIRICAALGAESFTAPFILSCIQTLLAAHALYTRCSSPYSGAAILTFCFLPVYFAGSSVFTAALICLNASVYVRERRFFRYAALILTAACFDMSALLLLPLYFVTLIPNIWISAAVSAAIAALGAVFTKAADAVYGFFGEGLYTSAQSTVACAVIAIIASVLCILMFGMFKNRNGHYENLVPVLASGAAFSLASVFDGRFFAVSLMLLMQSAVVLAPEAEEIAGRFLEIVFPKYKMTSRILFNFVCLAAVVGICVYLVYGDVFGSGSYEAALKAGLGI